MAHPSHGILMLPTTIQLCSTLARLATMLDKRPDLTSKVQKRANNQDEKKSLVEATAELIQRAFTICLTERTPNRNGIRDGKPEGKKIGIYSFANMVLKLLFQVLRTPSYCKNISDIQHSGERHNWRSNYSTTSLQTLHHWLYIQQATESSFSISLAGTTSPIATSTTLNYACNQHTTNVISKTHLTAKLFSPT